MDSSQSKKSFHVMCLSILKSLALSGPLEIFIKISQHLMTSLVHNAFYKFMAQNGSPDNLKDFADQQRHQKCGMQLVCGMPW